MFDNLKGMASMAGILKDLPRLKAKMEEVKARLADVVVDAETGGGAVRASANGQLQVTGLSVDPALLSALVDAGDAADRAMAEDLIVGAVNAALAKARAAAEDEVRRAAADMDLPLPPGALEGLMS
jgi:DNA-binding protein YbaB